MSYTPLNFTNIKDVLLVGNDDADLKNWRKTVFNTYINKFSADTFRDALDGAYYGFFNNVPSVSLVDCIAEKKQGGVFDF